MWRSAEHVLQVRKAQIDDVRELRLAERMEDDDVVHAVEELRAEVLAQLVHDAGLRVVEAVFALGPCGGELRRADVRGHDEHRVLEVHGAALAVGEAAVVEHLQEHVEDVGVRLLDLVEEHDGIRAAANGLGELAAFIEADVARRRADEASDGVALHVLAHVDAHHRGLVVEEELGEGARSFGLAHAGGAEEDEAADGALGIAEASAAAANGVRHGEQRLILADDALAQTLLHLRELLHLALEHFADGDAGPLGDDLRDVLFVDLFLEEASGGLRSQVFFYFVEAVLLVGQFGEVALRLGDLAVLQLGGALQVALAGGLLGLKAELFQAFLSARRSRRWRRAPSASARAGRWRAPATRRVRARRPAGAPLSSHPFRVGVHWLRSRGMWRGAPGRRSPRGRCQSGWRARPRPRRRDRWLCRAGSGR